MTPGTGCTKESILPAERTAPKGASHPYEKLEGEALDRHMIEQHGWTEHMASLRGTQTLADTTHGYTEDAHHAGHATAHLN